MVLKFRTILFTLMTLLLSIHCAFADEVKAAQQLSALLQRYQNFTADFSQVTFTQKGRVIQRSSGRLLLSRPGKFRWEALKPNKQIIIANNDKLWVYDVDLEQATVQKLVPGKSTDPATLLSGNVKELIKNFQVAVRDARGALWFQLLPKQKEGVFKKVLMQFKNNELVGMRVLNNLDQTSIFKFSTIQVDADIDPALFIFKPNKNVDVVRQ